jgi:hypothetical protein
VYRGRSIPRTSSSSSRSLRAMARHEIEGAGAQKFPSNVRVLHVEQEVSARGRGRLPRAIVGCAATDGRRDWVFSGWGT